MGAGPALESEPTSTSEARDTFEQGVFARTKNKSIPHSAPSSLQDRASIEKRLRSIPLQISVELPDGDADETMLAVAEGRVTHQIVKKRRRIPVWLTLAAFATVIYAAMVSTVCLAFCAYIFNKARQPRAQRAVDGQNAIILPILRNITAMIERLQPRK